MISRHQTGNQAGIAIGGAKHAAHRREALGAIGRRQSVSGHAVQIESQLPGEVHRILDAGVHPLPANGTEQVEGISRQHNMVLQIVIGDAVIEIGAGGPGEPLRRRHLRAVARQRGVNLLQVRHRTRRRQAPGFFNHNPDLIVRHGQENQKALLINMVGGPRERRRGVELHIRHHKMQRIVMTAKADPGQLPDGAGRAVGADNIVISGGTGPTGIVEQGDVIALPLPAPGDQLVPASHLPPGGG